MGSRQFERLRFEIHIDLLLNRRNVFSCALEQFQEWLALRVSRRDAKIVGFFSFRRSANLLVGMVKIRNEDNPPRSVLFSVDRLIDERSVAGESRTVEWTFRIRFLRLVPEDDDDLAGCIDALVIVVMELGSCDSVAGKNKRSFNLCRVGKSDGNEVFVEL